MLLGNLSCLKCILIVLTLQSSYIPFHLDRIGYAGGTNIQEEQQQKLDILSNEIMVNLLIASKKTAILISEELEEAIVVAEENKGVCML